MNTIDMSNDYKGLLVVIPTRNRADLAINAILSVLNQPNCEEVQVLVSDNSTDLKDIEILHKFCQENDNERLKYIKPPEPLSMSKHWDWAINKALELYDLNHFLYLTDRTIFKLNDLKEIKLIAQMYPEEIISYGYDTVLDHKTPVEVLENIWTGKILKVKSSHLLSLSSKCIMPASLPKMLNCVVPRSIFNTLSNHFKNIFTSISPDYCFAYRCLAICEHILYYDKAPISMYGIERSNGSAFCRGLYSETTKDFITSSTLNGSGLLADSPIPEFRCVCNAKLNEYYFVKKETRSPKFLDIDKGKYLEAVAGEVACFENEELKLKMLELLKLNGWQEKNVSISSTLMTNLKKIKKLFNIKKVFKKIIQLTSKDKNISNPNFNTAQEAIEYATLNHGKKTSNIEHLKYLIESEDVTSNLQEEIFVNKCDK